MDDQYSAVQQFNKRAYTVVFDEEGEHTIRLENNGLKNPSATGNAFNIDCFKVFREKEAVKDDNASLLALTYSLNGGEAAEVPGFSSEKTSYEAVLPEGTEGTVVLTGTAASASAAVQPGTAEIKDSQDDTDGVERGWFICETADPAAAKPVAVVGMIEDVKGKGGSNYVTEKVGNIAAAYESAE